MCKKDKNELKNAREVYISTNLCSVRREKYNFQRGRQVKWFSEYYEEPRVG
jgi:hypothetical protein